MLSPLLEVKMAGQSEGLKRHSAAATSQWLHIQNLERKVRKKQWRLVLMSMTAYLSRTIVKIRTKTNGLICSKVLLINTNMLQKMLDRILLKACKWGLSNHTVLLMTSLRTMLERGLLMIQKFDRTESQRVRCRPLRSNSMRLPMLTRAI